MFCFRTVKYSQVAVFNYACLEVFSSYILHCSDCCSIAVRVSFVVNPRIMSSLSCLDDLDPDNYMGPLSRHAKHFLKSWLVQHFTVSQSIAHIMFLSILDFLLFIVFSF